ncbi:protein kinase, partial [Oleispira antarctica]
MTENLKVSIGQYSDKGRKKENQDFHGSRIPNTSLLALKGIAVAMGDGISSSQTSHIASSSAVKTFLDDYYCTSEAWTVKKSVERVLKPINSWLYSQTMSGAGRYDKDKGYVSTFSALILKNHSAHLFHVGDTRIYRLTEQGLEQLTNDHRLWATGDSGESKSYLSRALGIEDQCSFDHQTISLNQGDVFLLCTDGIYEFVPSKDLIVSIQQQNDLDEVAQSIVQQAYYLGSDDNLSIQLIRIEELPEQKQVNLAGQVEQLPLPPVLEARMEFDGYTILRNLHANS